MDHIAIREDANHLADGIALADIGEELVAKPCSFGSAFDDPCDVDEGDGGRKDLLRIEDFGEDREPGIRNSHDTDIRFDGGEGVVGSEDIVLRQRVEEGGLAYIRQSDDSNREAHEG